MTIMMRFERPLVLLFAAYFTLLGGSPYYFASFPVRVGHHVIMTVVIAGWLIARLVRRRALPGTPINGALLIVGIVYAITMITSRDVRLSVEIVWFPLMMTGLFFIVAGLIEDGKIRLVLETQLLMAAVVVLIALLQLGSWLAGWGLTPETTTGWLETGLFPQSSPRLYMPLGVTTWLAAYTAPLAVFAAIKAYTERQHDLRVGLWVLAGLLIAVNVLTGSRGGLIALGAAGAAFALMRLAGWSRFQQMPPARRLIYGLLPLAVVVIAAGVVLVWSQTRAGSDALRLTLWRGAIELTADAPVSGVGVGVFGRAFRDVRDPQPVDDRLMTAHNIFLNTAAETGLIGVGALVGLIGVAGWAWFQRWRAATGVAQLRLEAAAAALIGFGVQSQFDFFTAAPILLLVCVLTAVCVVTPRDRTLPLPRVGLPRLLPVIALLVLVSGYAGLLLHWNRGYGEAVAARTADAETRLLAAGTARQIDPGLNLYRLWEASLLGDRAAYEQAVLLEPTWDTGWIHLAALREAEGDAAGALEALDRARAINATTPAMLHWSRIAETTAAAPSAAIIEGYRTAMLWGELPLSSFWTATPLRRAALDAFATAYGPETAYRIYAAHDLARLPAIVAAADEDMTGEGDWVRGEAALQAGDAAAAQAAFEGATRRQPMRGDYYASLARALIALGDVSAAQQALTTAELLLTTYEYPNAIRADLAQSATERRTLWASAVPPRIQDQNFEGVLYNGRVVGFDLPPIMRRPGPGGAALAPWYALAADYTETGEREAAITVYRAILDRAPEETTARDRLAVLEEESP